ncbi:hypothetical protein [Parashewanella tropica]|uniref:hypothetical protein n=1 Tax=Parashewanella tropica TaxID=2547970 RepID=UPI00105A62AF|nr:hypothetical protein [Parashewanella tropica]
MAFKIIESESHFIDGNKLTLKYHRFSTKLEISFNDELLQTRYLFFAPYRTIRFQADEHEFNIKILWIIFWRSRLYQAEELKVAELLPQRRRKSVILMSYTLFIASLKFLLLS